MTRLYRCPGRGLTSLRRLTARWLVADVGAGSSYTKAPRPFGDSIEAYFMQPDVSLTVREGAEENETVSWLARGVYLHVVCV